MGSKKTSDALKIIDRRFFATPESRAELEDARSTAHVARQILELRKRVGLTQRELAKLVGTSHSVISHLEDDDYEGHSLSMLRRIAAALGKRIEVQFVPTKRARSA